MAGYARALGGLLLDLVYPPQCSLCREYGPAICDACLEGVVPTPPSLAPPPLQAVAEVGAHTGSLREAILHYKYRRDLSLLRPLGGLLANTLMLAEKPWELDALVPVPLHWRRKWWRSFDQALLLAREVSRQASVPVLAALTRTRNTRSQARLDSRERATNVEGAFTLKPGVSVRGLRLALVDDVRTTGATLVEAAGPRLDAGAAAVYGLTLSHEPSD